MAQPSRVFLTGATGFIGRSLVGELLRAGYGVRALVRDPDARPARELAQLGVRLVTGDVTDRESMREAMHSADLVVHAAGVLEFGVAAADRARMTAVNVQGTDNVLGLALELQCPRVLQVACALAWGDSGGVARDERHRRGEQPFVSHFEWTQAEALALGRAYARRGLPLVIACPNGVVGANDHSVFGYLLRLHLNHLMPPVAPSPDCMLPLVHVDDLARGLLACAQRGRPGQAYFLCGERTTLREIFELWSDEVPGGARIRWWVPQWTGWMMLAPVGPLLRTLGLQAFLSSETARQAGRHLDYSSAKARRELDWRATPARAMWHRIGQEELRLAARRRGASLVQRLKPLDDA
jgi:nucleoside-diphosphate-sugar epimerase